MDLEKLRRPFPSSEVKQRQGGGGKKLDYVAIESVLGRLLEDAPEYSWHIQSVELRMTVEGNKHVAVVIGQLQIGDKVGAGIGAMVNADPDMAVKSANSEAMKNAAKNGFGVALELWDEGHRQQLATDRALASGDLQTLKSEVYRRAQVGLDSESPTKEEVAEYFNIAVADLNKKAALKAILGL